MPEQFHFLHPAWFLALLPMALLLWAVRHPGRAGNPWRRVVDERLLPWLLVGGEGRRSSLPLWLLAVGWLVAVLALADPVWEKQPQPVYRSQEARVVVLDLSRSMLATDLKPSRLVRARYKVDDVLRRSKEGQTGLVVFAGDAFAVSPLTTDAATIEALLQPLHPDLMPAPGSRADLGLLKAAQLLRQAGLHHGEVLLIADGADGERALDAAKKLRRAGYRVSVLGVGTPEGAPVPDGHGGYVHDASGNIVVARLDRDALRRLAAAGGGRYATIRGDERDLDALLPAGEQRFGQAVKRSELKADVWQSRGPWLVLLLLPLAALVFRRGWLLALALLMGTATIAPQPAMAASWDDLWLRRDQQAEQLLQNGKPEQALGVAREPLRRGTAAYRAGRYQDAVKAFSAAEGADAAYNRGNALARLGRYREAIEAYDQALAARPGMADAEYNRAQVEKLLRQQEKQKQQQKQAERKNRKQSSKNGGGQSSQQQQQAGGKQQKQGQQQQPQSGPGGRQQPEAGEQAHKEGAQLSGQQQQSGDKAQEPQQAQEREGKEQQQHRQQAAGARQRRKEQNRKAQAASGKQGEQGQQKQQAARAAKAKPPAREGEQPGQSQARAKPLDTEEQQAAEQWLRRIPDDPGGLLRRKFLYQYRQRGAQAGNGGQQTW